MSDTQRDPKHDGIPHTKGPRPKGPRCARQFPTVHGGSPMYVGFPHFMRVFPTVRDFSHDVPSCGVPLGRVSSCVGPIVFGIPLCVTR